MQTRGNQSMYCRLLFILLMLRTFVYATDSDVENFSYTHEVKVLVSDTEIVSGHMIRIKIRATGDRVSFPNIEEIDGVKVLEQRERITNKFHYINGVLNKEHTTLILTLAPHHNITIPSYDIEIDGKIYKTKPVKIKVMAVNAQNMEDNNKFFLHLKTDKKSVIVGEPIIVTVYLSLRFGVKLSDNPHYTQPLFKGFFSKQIGNRKVYNEGNRQITEFNYLLTPYSVGEFSIGPARANIGVPNSKKRDMFGRIIATVWIPIASNRVKVKVMKKPQESNLVGHFNIDNTFDTKNVKVNKPVKLTVKIIGEGSLEDFEFPDFEIDGVTVYSDDAEIIVDLNDSMVHSTYSKSFVFISDRNFTIPARRISVYDTQNKIVKVLEVPSCDIEVEGSQRKIQEKPQAKISYADKVYFNLKTPQKSMLESEEKSNYFNEYSTSWWMMVLAFILGMMVMYMTQFLKIFKIKPTLVKEDEALKILYGHIGEDKEIEEMVHKLYAKKNGDNSIEIDKKKLKELVECFRKIK